MPSPPAAPAAERDLSVTPVSPPAAPVTPIGPKPAPTSAQPSPAAAPKPAEEEPNPFKKLEGPAEAPINPPAARPPVAPGGEERAPVELPPPADETVQRVVQRPVMTASTSTPYRRPARLLHWLEGKVIAGDSGRPEEGVKVTLARTDRAGTELVVLSDDAGRYGVRLPDGSWSVRVTMPSGRTYTVSELIVEKGQISDDLGRPIPTLTITR
ncbi:MAG: carboxypeptidase regulatory-like domain-containing protein [Isosphaeraceae bacterium]